MEIRLSKPSCRITFKNIGNGTVFFCEGNFYMKTELIKNQDIMRNAVDLKTGKIFYFEEEYEVIVINGYFQET